MTGENRLFSEIKMSQQKGTIWMQKKRSLGDLHQLTPLQTN